MSAPGANWKLAWSDEFNGNRVDGSKWSFGLPWASNGDQQSDNSFLSYNTPNNVSIGDGALHLSTQRQDATSPSGAVYHYTGAFMSTSGKFNMRSGYVEIRAQVPTGAGPGLWPAFWMLSDGWPPEDDVAEFQTSTNRSHQGLAYGGGGAVHWDDTNTYTPLPSGFHTYGMEWGNGYQIFNIDGKITHVTRGGYVPNVPMYLILDSEVDAGMPPTDATTFPNSFDVDYVRVYQRDATPYVSNGDFEGGSLGLWEGTGNAVVEQDQVLDGSASLRLEGSGSSVQQTITRLQPNTTYVLTADAQASDGNQASIGVNGYGGDDTSTTLTSTAVTPLSVSFTTGRGVTSGTIYGLQSGGTGDVWLDNVAIHQAGTLQNPGFELGTIGAWNATGPVSVVRGAHGGLFALREDGSSATASQTVYGLLPNTTYRLTAWARVSGADDQASFGVQQDSGSPLVATVNAARYRQVALTFTTGSAPSAVTLFCSKLVGGGSAWFDDVQLTIPRKPAARNS